MTRYSFDTSSLIEASVRRYPQQAFPTLWENLEELVDNGRVIATEQVKAELERRDNALFLWAKQRDHMFIPISEEVALAVRDILKSHGKLIKTGKNRSMADPWVVALARVTGAVVVTEEEGGNANKPKIPSVCRELGIDCINLVDFVLSEGWTF